MDQSAPPELIHKVKAGDKYQRSGVLPGDIILSSEKYEQFKEILSRTSIAA